MIGVLFGGIVSVYGAWAGKLLLAAQPEELRGLIIKLGVGMLLLGAAVGGAAAWGAWRYYSRRVDWDRIATEQRLWESGPLGRAWLKVRQRIIDGV